MEHVSNEDYARHLCCSGCNNYVCYTNQEQCRTLKDLLIMADWKDEEHAKEKQKLIDEACKWWEREFLYPTMTQEEIDWYQTKIAEFKKAMKGE